MTYAEVNIVNCKHIGFSIAIVSGKFCGITQHTASRCSVLKYYIDKLSDILHKVFFSRFFQNKISLSVPKYRTLCYQNHNLYENRN